MGYILPVATIGYLIVRSIKKNTLWFRSLSEDQKSYIKKHFRHYNNYSKEDQLLFEKRVHKFISLKEFTPRGGLSEITEEMKVLIASTAVQITFGYSNVYFKHFKKILVYPDTYYSTITKKYHQGEVNMRGIIVISWKKFIEGFKDDTNGRNLGYHEMAHAITLENMVQNDEYKFLNYEAFVKFSKLCIVEMKKVREGDSSFFRKYAGTNKHEFIAVAIENFFERPKEFQQHNKKLYELTSKLLNQNPLKVNGGRTYKE